MDAGGTGTRALLRDEQSGMEGRGVGGVGNPRVVGIEVAAQSIRNAIEGAVATVGCEWTDIRGACLGMAGVGRSPLGGPDLSMLESRLALECPVKVMSDLEIAHGGVFRGGSGVLVVMGTGSSILARSANGSNHQVGGWGWAVDDVGGATDMGGRALALLMDQFDRGVGIGILGKLILTHAEVTDVNQLVGWLYRDADLRGRLSKLAPVVSDGLEAGCLRARSVAQASFQILINKIEWAVDRAGLVNGFTITVLGGMTQSGHFMELFEVMLQQRFPEVGFYFKNDRGEVALEGALMLA